MINLSALELKSYYRCCKLTGSKNVSIQVEFSGKDPKAALVVIALPVLIIVLKGVNFDTRIVSASAVEIQESVLFISKRSDSSAITSPTRRPTGSGYIVRITFIV
jgi:hypothetical protein